MNVGFRPLSSASMSGLLKVGHSVVLDSGSLPTPNQCHLWSFPVRLRPKWLDFLSEAERATAEEFQVEGPQAVFVTSRAAQRLIGAHYLGVAPREVMISRTCIHCGGAHGRPKYIGSTLDYSVSHTIDLVIVAVVEGGSVGVDMESTRTARNTAGFAHMVLTSSERGYLATVPANELTHAFLKLWSRKEAVVKLSGYGLLTPMTQIDVLGSQVVAHNMPPLWPSGSIHLNDFSFDDDHVAALASDSTIDNLVMCDLAIEE